MRTFFGGGGGGPSPVLPMEKQKTVGNPILHSNTTLAHLSLPCTSLTTMVTHIMLFSQPDLAFHPPHPPHPSPPRPASPPT